MVSPVFIGRQDEMSALTAMLSKAGFLAVAGQCLELGAAGLPLAPLVDVLRTLARSLPPDAT